MTTAARRKTSRHGRRTWATMTF
ncbi:hypothetical protein RB2654_14410 [Rhodobacterales bacterium HTCC2654]|uniref:Uncharacterized protein n=1 Tax=Maritimibacter alkaliphilus HTCC2654 TaxID=314271 RepID=A3VGT1_9RHOB|nr:hypothetical protein RB2654_14410 [Rhodobacterales bacterium HTCC2654] [Maritimibacter alkaliphilus HTCC2654]